MLIALTSVMFGKTGGGGGKLPSLFNAKIYHARIDLSVKSQPAVFINNVSVCISSYAWFYFEKVQNYL